MQPYIANGYPTVYPEELEDFAVPAKPMANVIKSFAARNRPYAECDTECARNYWLLKFYLPMGGMYSFELRPGKPQFTLQELWDLGRIFQQFTVVTFNGLNYDIPMIKYALSGASVSELKALNDDIIPKDGNGLKRWDVRKYYPQVDIPGLDHVDIMEVVPGVRIGLKTYMARMHAPTIQDLPFDPAEELSEEKIKITDDYCGNDLVGTQLLRKEVNARLVLRERLSEKYGTDLRSKSDAQMSEAIIASQLGYRPDVPYLPSGTIFQFTPAPWLQFATPQLVNVLELCKRVNFLWSRNDEGEEIISPDGTKIKTGVNMPAELAKVRVVIGRSIYKFGIGGLHSQESALTMRSTDAGVLFDRDVGSFYPSLAILLKLFSPEIMAIYQDIYDQRMSAKGTIGSLKAQIKQAADKRALEFSLEEIETLVGGFKIVMNGWYGKLWSKYSFALAPAAGIGITLNGQLSLLMLIERLELGGVSVVSANTDGIICYVPTGLEFYYREVFKWWEATTGLTTDETPYSAIHMRGVNAYVAIKPDGETKRKGCYSESGINASMQGIHPDRDIAKDAAVKYLLDGTPVGRTIRACNDIKKFVLSRKVAGGGAWRGQYLGGTVRWYYADGGEEIRGAKSGNKVAGSDGAMPIQVLPTSMPADVDYAKYEAYAIELLQVCGALPTLPKIKTPRSKRVSIDADNK